MTTARETMTPDATCVKASETVRDAARRMAELGAGALPVCGADEKPKGMPTDRDIVLEVVAEGLDPAECRVGGLARDEIVRVRTDAEAEEVLDVMKEHKARRVPVIDGHVLVGVIAQADVARALPDREVGDLVGAVSADRPAPGPCPASAGALWQAGRVTSETAQPLAPDDGAADAPAAEFTAHRPRMFGPAHRMLGSAEEAEDTVQDAYLRWSGADRASIAHPAARLATVVTRLGPNRLASARAKREEYAGPWLPEPVFTRDGTLGPLESAERRDAVSTALLVLLERLTPTERAVYVLPPSRCATAPSAVWRS
ncbi:MULTISPECIES: CBS domain-containing protein [unclassified Streptomyces]|uniref:CBS domain-containing protein n=1 Tax=unclassified Streptomyces TaxID=2593676 RepID=UPI00381BEB26